MKRRVIISDSVGASLKGLMKNKMHLSHASKVMKLAKALQAELDHLKELHDADKLVNDEMDVFLNEELSTEAIEIDAPENIAPEDLLILQEEGLVIWKNLS